MSNTFLEIIVVLFAFLVLIKITVILIFSPRFWIEKIAKKIYSGSVFSFFVFIILAAIILYFLLIDLNIIQIFAVVVFASLFMAAGFSLYFKATAGFAHSLPKELTFLQWIYMVFWVILSIAAIYAVMVN